MKPAVCGMRYEGGAEMSGRGVVRKLRGAGELVKVPFRRVENLLEGVSSETMMRGA
jgi:hypothetical protein